MTIDFLINQINKNSWYSGSAYKGLTKFKKEYSKFLNNNNFEVFIRCHSKTDYIYNWRLLPIKNIEFYRCPRITSQLKNDSLNLHFINSEVMKNGK